MADGSLFSAGGEEKLELDRHASEGIWRVSRITAYYKLPIRSEAELTNDQWLLNDENECVNDLLHFV